MRRKLDEIGITIICPLYNAENYIEELYNSIIRQKNVNILELKFILTESSDSTEEIMRKLDIDYIKIRKEEFSHSLTREKAAFSSNGNILVFITQDVKINDELWLSNLIHGIKNGECDAAFSRQVGYEEHGLERYIREINYPSTSRIIDKGKVDELGIMAFFFSDVASAIKKDVFIKLNGYDGINLSTNEDMYFAYKLINNGFKIKYEAKSVVVHSHELKLKDVFKRYKEIGRFFIQNPDLDKFNAIKKGQGVLLYVIKRGFKDKDYRIIFNVIMNFAVRFIGLKVGRRNNEVVEG